MYEGDDDAFLDDVFDRAVRRAGTAEPLDLEDAARERPALRERLAEVLLLARETAFVRPPGPPPVPGFDVLGELGRGANGVVYLARQRGLGRVVALKVLLPHAAASPSARARLRAEAEALGRLRHEGVVAVHAFVSDGPFAAIAMERVEGGSLADLLARGADPPPFADAAAACRFARDAALALGAVHRAGLTHRDVKPSNLLIGVDGRPKLTDFGLVRDPDLAGATRTGTFVGTLAYAAPEQLRGRHDVVGPRADVFALGAVLFEMLARRPPTRATDPLERAAEIERGAPSVRRARREVSRDLDAIVATALDPDPARRYADGAAFADDLDRLLALRPVTARPPSWGRRLRLLAARRRGAAAAAFAAVVAAALGVFAAGRAISDARRRAADEATRPARVREALRAARLLLLAPDYGERMFQRALGGEDVAGPHDAAALAAAVDAYDAVLGLAPETPDARRERAVVDAARGRAPPPHSQDARAAGLWAYLRGKTAEALAAWRGLDLDLASPDPLVDAALGQLHAAEFRYAAAYPRLLSAAREFPEAGFLAVEAADCAVKCGDAALALRLLAHARRLGRLDPYESDVRVEAEARAALGDLDAAEILLRHLGARRREPLKRLRLAELLGRRGLAEEAEYHALEAWDAAARRPLFAVGAREAVALTFARLDARGRDAWVVRSFEPTAREAALLGAFARKMSRPTDPVATLPDFGASPEERVRAFADLSLPAEVSMLLDRRSVFVRPDVRSGVARLARLLSPACAARPRALRVVAALLAAVALSAPVAGQTAPFEKDFEFNRDGEMPWMLPNVNLWAGNHFPAVACGKLQQRGFANGGFSSGSMVQAGVTPFGGPGSALTFNPAYPVVIEMRNTMLNLSGPTPVIYYMCDGAHYVDLGWEADQMIRVAGTITPYTGSETYTHYFPVANFYGVPHTYRIELDSTSGLVSYFADGVQVGPTLYALPCPSNNFFLFGDISGSTPSTGDADWDYVRVRNAPAGGLGQENRNEAQLEINGLRGMGPGPHAVTNVNNTTLNFTWGGPPGMPFTLVKGPLNVAGAGYGCIGLTDLGTPPFYQDLVFLFDGFNPVYAPFFSLGPCGTAVQTITIPPLPPGLLLGHFQGLVLQPPSASCPFLITAAFTLTT